MNDPTRNKARNARVEACKKEIKRVLLAGRTEFWYADVRTLSEEFSLPLSTVDKLIQEIKR